MVSVRPVVLAPALLIALMPLAANAADKGSAKKPIAKPGDDDIMGDEPEKGADKPASASGTPGQKSGPNVLLVPLQPVFRSVPPNKIQTANDLLQKELNQKDTLVVIVGGISKGGKSGAEPGDPKDSEGAKALADAAEKAESNREIRKAIELRKKAIDEMEKHAAKTSPDAYVMAYHLLARALMWAGDDKDAMEAIDTAARMRPALPLEAKDFSRLYRKWFQRASETALSAKPGDLLVSSVLPGAAITLDGRSMDVAPVLLKKVVAGKHLVGARIEGVPPFAAVVDVKPQKKNEIVVNFQETMGGSAVGVVADALAKNSIPKKAVESAAQAGKEAGAQFVVIGALAKDEDKFHVHPFVVEVASAKIAQLGVVDFDLDLLTAESDVLRVVLAVSESVGKFTSSDKEVQVIDKRIKMQSTVNEIAAAPSLTDEGGKHDNGAGGKKARAIYKPLKGGKLQIKDEEQDEK